MVTLDLGPLWHVWPLLLVALGVGELVGGRGKGHASRALSLIVVGAVLLSVDLRGVVPRWRDAWPFALVFVGCCLVLDALARRRSGGTDAGGAP